MPAPVGIAMQPHSERVTPRDADYAAFFDLLRAEGRRTVPLEGTLDAASLREVGALLVGLPTRWRSEHEVAAVHAWVAAGGALLALASFGGDSLPDGIRREGSNLAQLLPGVTARADCLGLHEGAADPVDGYPAWRFQRVVPVEVSGLLGRPATLGYTSGCTLGLDLAPPTAPRGPREARRGWDFAVAPVSLLRALPVPAGAHVVADPVEEDGDLFAYDPTPQPAGGHLLVQLRYGAGTVTVFGAARSLTREGLGRDDTLAFALWLLSAWLPGHARGEVARRKARPQRHRLLHGYPMAPLMPAVSPAERASLEAMETAPLRPGAGLIVGVLPHPYCNPAVRGCGFCTFPHEAFSNAAAREVTARVAGEVADFGRRAPALVGSPVTAVYLGGGTANLTPVDSLRALGRTLADTFDLTDAELTLEGVPVYFTARGCAVLDALGEGFTARHRRVSMGVQTFDDAQLARMGRSAFGDRAAIEGVVQAARDRAIAVSMDLLFDLPGQSLADMERDVDVAAAMGVDHVCLYHLVLFEGLGTEWSHDRSLLAALPDNRRACDHWNALRERLQAAGYVQTSLTNFEHARVHEGPRRFRYEPCAYAPERYDLLGFGPSAISLRFGAERAVKLLNADGAEDYRRALDAGSARTRAFVYEPRDARVLYLTRKVVTLAVDRAAYRALFGTDAVADFAQELEALDVERLVRVTPEAVTLTPKGMFYADTVAGILAWRRVHEGSARATLRLGRPPRPRASTLFDVNDSRFDPMG